MREVFMYNPESSENECKLQYDNHIEISDNFRRALRIMENTSKSVFITGRAGTGKSTLLEYFRSITRKSIAVLAPTGVAALNVKGQTIHSFFRFRPDITPDTVQKLQYKGQKAVYVNLDTILIDEISMVRADLLDCIDIFMRINGRDSTMPFGGVQIVFVGDMYQLPPVVADHESEMFSKKYKSQYFFDSDSFKRIEVEFVQLEGYYRQKDAGFINLLNSIRNNTATDSDIEALNSRYNPAFNPNDSEKYITLTTTNRLADEINNAHMQRLQSPPYTFVAKLDGFNRDVLPADEELTLKVGAQVMLLNNDKQGRWVNGSIGVVTEINPQSNMNKSIMVMLTDGALVDVEPYKWELFKFSYDPNAAKLVSKSIGSFIQYPLMPAWAVTIHKSQGKTFDKVVIDIGNGTFAHGQLYVALSRCKTLDGIVLKKRLEKKHIIMDNKVTEFLAKYKIANG